MNNNDFGKKLQDLRKENGMTQRELGDRLGYSNQTVSFWESGRREPDLDALVAIAKVFDVSVDYLLGVKEY